MRGRGRKQDMPTVDVPAQLTVEHLMAAIKQLSPAEWEEFQQQLAQWQEQNGPREETEDVLLARIRENSRLPEAEQRRFNLTLRPGRGVDLHPDNDLNAPRLLLEVRGDFALETKTSADRDEPNPRAHLLV